jgi:hypothetical protein
VIIDNVITDNVIIDNVIIDNVIIDNVIIDNVIIDNDITQFMWSINNFLEALLLQSFTQVAFLVNFIICLLL